MVGVELRALYMQSKFYLSPKVLSFFGVLDQIISFIFTYSTRWKVVLNLVTNIIRFLRDNVSKIVLRKN